MSLQRSSTQSTFCGLVLSVLAMAVPLGGIAADWPDARRAGPFVCRADFAMQGVEPLLDELTQLQVDLTRELGVPPAKDEIQVYLFHDRETYDRYLKQQFPNVPFRRAVYIKENGLGRVFAFRSPQFEVDLRHECTHALLHASLNTVPLWLDEGLAGYFELPSGRRATGNPHLRDIRWNAWLGIVPSMESLEKCVDVSKMAKAEYRNSWAWVSFMINGPAEAHEELVSYLQDLQGQQPSPDPLSARLKSRIPDLNQGFVSHFRAGKSKLVQTSDLR
jgi:hypothetical protein